MRRAVPLTAAALLGVLALPASADYPPQDCAAALALATTGQQAGCATRGKTLNLDQFDTKVMNVYVQTGQVTATLSCGGDPLEQRTITVTAPWSGSASIPRTTHCWVTITATVDRTTAVVTNTSTQTLD